MKTDELIYNMTVYGKGVAALYHGLLDGGVGENEACRIVIGWMCAQVSGGKIAATEAPPDDMVSMFTSIMGKG